MKLNDFHKRIVIGAEIEAYSIEMSDYHISRKLSRPRPGLSESGERFTRDSSIGSEYNSRPFASVRESLFLLKTGLRKYLRNHYRSRKAIQNLRIPLLVGSWTNRVAGTHLHVSVNGQKLDLRRARSLAFPIHDHLPLLVALAANSPIWERKITAEASCRFLRGSETYFAPVGRGRLERSNNREMCFVPARKTKPGTLEIRVLDSNIPEFVVVCLCLVKAVALRWLRRKPASNRIRREEYQRARLEAARRGMRARLCWNGEWIRAADYLDRFLWFHRQELELMDIPDEIYTAMRWLKKGYNGAALIRAAAEAAMQKHPQTWQRRFARRYIRALEELLAGNTLRSFAEALRVEVPNVDRTWLGRRGASIDG